MLEFDLQQCQMMRSSHKRGCDHQPAKCLQHRRHPPAGWTAVDNPAAITIAGDVTPCYTPHLITHPFPLLLLLSPHRCKRIASHVSMLADALAETHPHIVVARLNCGVAEHFCDQVIKISRTPSFTVRRS